MVCFHVPYVKTMFDVVQDQAAKAGTNQLPPPPPLPLPRPFGVWPCLIQMRETKREQLATLRSKFEQDKARVAKMKMQRKFRPF